MTSIHLVIVLFLNLTYGLNAIRRIKEDTTYYATCTYTIVRKYQGELWDSGHSITIPCVTAMFSSKTSYLINHELDVINISDFCNDETIQEQNRKKDFLDKSAMSIDKIAVAYRGNCSFETKIRNAAKYAHIKGLIVIDNPDPNFDKSSNFAKYPDAPGAATPNYQSSIPCLLVRREVFIDYIQDISSTHTNTPGESASISENGDINYEADDSYVLYGNISYIVPELVGGVSTVSSENTQEMSTAGNKGVAGKHFDDNSNLRAIDFNAFLRKHGVAMGNTIIALLCCVCIGSIYKLTSDFRIKPSVCPGLSVADEVAVEFGTVLGVDVVYIVLLVALIAFGNLIRCGTFRLAHNDMTASIWNSESDRVVVGKLLSPYDHRETDEFVYEVLVQSIAKDPWNYSLYDKPEILIQLNLEFEQYFTKTFIHPPIFVYFSAMLYQFLKLPLVAVPLVCQTIVMFCMPLQHYIVRNESFDWKTCSLWSVLLFCCCPISVLISQKFWIDNMLLFTVYVCVTIQLCLLKWLCQSGPSAPSLTPSDKQNLMNILSFCGGGLGIVDVLKCVIHLISTRVAGYCMVSGFVSSLCFGVFACNTKITALTAVPAVWAVCTLDLTSSLSKLLLWELGGQYPGQKESLVEIDSKLSKSKLDNGKLKLSVFRVAVVFVLLLVASMLLSVVVIILGLCIGHGPWLLFHKSECNRWLPNSWPSAGMLAKSKYMRTVVGRPPTFYVNLLFEKAPLHLLGMFYGLLHFVSVVYQAYCKLVSGTCRLGTLEIVRAQVFTLENMHITMLTLVSWAVLLGHSVLGFLGGGSQTRFIALVSPAASMLLGHYLSRVREGGIVVAVTMLFFVMCASTVYYGILYAPLFSDLDNSVLNILFDVVLYHPYFSIQSPESGQDLTRFMGHYGLRL